MRKQVLDELPGVYAVGQVTLGGMIHVLAASEARERCLVFAPPDWTPSTVWKEPGGCMGLIPLPGRDGVILAIQRFFPIFQSQQAIVVLAAAHGSAGQPWSVTPILDVPYVHRIEVLQTPVGAFLVAGVLCSSKDYQDDWSKPGQVLVGGIPRNLEAPWSLTIVMSGLTKNHGMHATRLEGCPVVLVSGTEGLFELAPPNKSEGEWRIQQMLDHEISDVYAYDLDQDGFPELGVIAPFHGNSFLLYKRINGKWEPVYEAEMRFGHVVWMGSLLGTPGIILGNRDGERDLIVLRPRDHTLKSMDAEVIDSGIGPSQVTVISGPGADSVLSANNAVGEVALYRLTK